MFKISMNANTAEVVLFGTIGDWGADATDIHYQLQNLTANQVKVRINSYGGDAFEGVAIMNILRSHPAEVTCIVEGVAASAASIIAVGAGRCIMREGSQLMIHDPFYPLTTGTADELRKQADDLDKLRDSMASIYAGVAGGTEEFWRDRMAEETWYTADEAVAAGLADSVETGRADMQSAGRAAAHYKYSGRGTAPAPVLMQKENAMTMQEKLADKLAELMKNDGATPEEIQEALDNLTKTSADEEPQENAEGPDNAQTPVEDADNPPASSPADADTDSITAAEAKLATARAKAATRRETLTVTIDKGVFDELQRDAEFGRDARIAADKAKRENLVAAAIKDGRISAATSGKWLERLENDPLAEAELAALPVLIPRNEIGHGQTTEETVNTGNLAAAFPKIRI